MTRACPDCEAPRRGPGRCACGSWAAPAESREPSRPRFKNGRQLPVGEGLGDAQFEHVAPVPARGRDAKLDKPKRPCAGCGRKFAPTVKRRLLCADCYKRADSGSPYEPTDHGDPALL